MAADQVLKRFSRQIRKEDAAKAASAHFAALSLSQTTREVRYRDGYPVRFPALRAALRHLRPKVLFECLRYRLGRSDNCRKRSKWPWIADQHIAFFV